MEFVCTSFKNVRKASLLASFSGLFRSECKYISYLQKMYVQCILFLSCNAKNSIATAKFSENSRSRRRSNRFLMVSSLTSALILLPYLTVAQH